MTSTGPGTPEADYSKIVKMTKYILLVTSSDKIVTNLDSEEQIPDDDAMTSCFQVICVEYLK